MKPRVELLEGRKHFVVPVVLAVEGVLNGSNGPLFYPADELRRYAPAWNGKPIVVYHPGVDVSVGAAGHPAVFNNQKVGTVFAARYDAKSRALKGEAWLDPERLAVVDPRVLRAVQNGDMVEVSTGLYTDQEETGGVFRGRKYSGIARNHRPDHLAILPDEKGACSIADGAGLCRNRSWMGQVPLVRRSVMDLVAA